VGHLPVKVYKNMPEYPPALLGGLEFGHILRQV
jgi:hypothetical protein